mmetsp:Transcript_107844/g.287119  ORF Transcript_107844/g.287119 Transcript_107844/m.287119 type:complete len:280 (-) Transcript_107844:444-1283(-)
MLLVGLVHTEALPHPGHGRDRLPRELGAASSSCCCGELQHRTPETGKRSKLLVRACSEPKASTQSLRGMERLRNLLWQPDLWSTWLGVVAKNEAEVDVEELSLSRQAEILQMPVSNPEDVRDHARRSHTSAEIVEHLVHGHVRLAVPVQPRDEVALRLVQSLRERDGIWHKLHVAGPGSHGQDSELGQLQELCIGWGQPLLPNTPHQGHDLQHQLILPQVIANLEQVLRPVKARRLAACVQRAGRCPAREKNWGPLARHDLTLLSNHAAEGDRGIDRQG